MKINDEAGFDRAGEWLIERAALIDAKDLETRNPLLDAQTRERWRVERAEHMRKYDMVTEEIERYKKKFYFPQQEAKPQTALDAWLDD